MIFVDTNYFLRFLLADQEVQHHTAKMLFKKADELRKEIQKLGYLLEDTEEETKIRKQFG